MGVTNALVDGYLKCLCYKHILDYCGTSLNISSKLGPPADSDVCQTKFRLQTTLLGEGAAGEIASDLYHESGGDIANTIFLPFCLHQK